MRSRSLLVAFVTFGSLLTGVACSDGSGGSPAGTAGSAASATGGSISGGGVGGSIGGAATGGTATGGGASGAGTGGHAGSGCARRELFTNGTFDAGGTGWTEISGKGSNLIVTAEAAEGNVMPHSGTHFARLGGYTGEADTAQDNLIGTVEVPASAQNLVFSYYSSLRSGDQSGQRHDVLHLALDSDLQYVEQILDNTTVRPTWQRFEMSVDPMAAGKTLVLLVRAENDATLPTTFFLDSVSLTAAECP
jgi:hypothetical protein